MISIDTAIIRGDGDTGEMRGLFGVQRIETIELHLLLNYGSTVSIHYASGDHSAAHKCDIDVIDGFIFTNNHHLVLTAFTPETTKAGTDGIIS